jgi:hypothetical protein
MKAHSFRVVSPPLNFFSPSFQQFLDLMFAMVTIRVGRTIRIPLEDHDFSQMHNHLPTIEVLSLTSCTSMQGPMGFLAMPVALLTKKGQ